mgnify:CR=1 FL=1
MTDIANLIDEFFPTTKKKMEEIKNKKFIHYTSAENAFKIIQNQEIWLRKVICMNDFSEINCGRELFIDFFTNENNKHRLNNIIKKLDNNATVEDFYKICDYYIETLEHKIFISCFSEHDTNDTRGKLSMWRGYANGHGAALVINPSFLDEQTHVPNYLFFTVPVIYNQDKYIDNFKTILKLLETDDIINKIKNIYQNNIYGFFYVLSIIFCCHIVSFKHEGFEEEKEWRIVLWHYSSDTENTKENTIKNDRNIDIKKTIETIRGIPQIVYKIPLKSFNFIPNTNNALLNKIIIGPNSNIDVLKETFTTLLSINNVNNPEDYIVASDIPFRNPI